MGSRAAAMNNFGPRLRHAALIAGLAYLLMPVAIAEFGLFPKLVVPGHIEQTTQNIAAHASLFGAAIGCYLVTLILDVIIAWALYILLAPVNRPLSLLTAWFRLVYTSVAIFAVLHLVTVFRLATTPDFVTLFGTDQLHAQIALGLRSFRYDWSVSLTIFGIHLALLGYLVFRSGYIPRLLGVLLTLDGLGWVASGLQPYLYPNLDLQYFFMASFVELLLPIWLVVRGWKIPEPAAPPESAVTV